jgi:hypothetical protein
MVRETPSNHYKIHILGFHGKGLAALPRRSCRSGCEPPMVYTSESFARQAFQTGMGDMIVLKIDTN